MLPAKPCQRTPVSVPFPTYPHLPVPHWIIMIQVSFSPRGKRWPCSKHHTLFMLPALDECPTRRQTLPHDCHIKLENSNELDYVLFQLSRGGVKHLVAFVHAETIQQSQVDIKCLSNQSYRWPVFQWWQQPPLISLYLNTDSPQVGLFLTGFRKWSLYRKLMF